jgi:TATA-binding protein-associated factor Taf7
LLKEDNEMGVKQESDLITENMKMKKLLAEILSDMESRVSEVREGRGLGVTFLQHSINERFIAEIKKILNKHW